MKKKLIRAAALLRVAPIAAVLVVPAWAACTPEVSAESAVLVCAETGETLLSRKADERMLIASTTKIMTAVIVLENCALTDEVTADGESAAVEGSSMYLKAGETYTVEQLLYGMMLASGNDGATALAKHVSGSIEAFAALMNYKARELGMTDSAFKNPTGLDAEGQYSTAADMARLAVYAMRDRDFARIVGTKSYVVGDMTYVNHNKLLWCCDGVIGLKTGYTRASGRTLVSCCVREGARYVCVTLNDPRDWEDHQRLYDWAEENYDYVAVMSAEDTVSVPVVSGVKDRVRVSPVSDVMALLRSGQTAELRFLLPRFIFAGITAGEPAGEVGAFSDGRQVAWGRLIYAEDAPVDVRLKLTPAERFRRFWSLAGLAFGKSYYLQGEE